METDVLLQSWWVGSGGAQRGVWGGGLPPAQGMRVGKPAPEATSVFSRIQEKTLAESQCQVNSGKNTG